MLQGMRVKLYPTVKQQSVIDHNINGNRWVYNHALRIHETKYREWEAIKENLKPHEIVGAKKEFGKTFIGKFDMMKIFTEMKKDPQTAWLKDLNAQSIQNTIVNLDIAFMNFFNGRASYPRPKKHFDSKQSVQYPQGVKIVGQGLKVPKTGVVKAKGIRDDLVIDKIKTCTITRDGGEYYMSLLIETNDPIKPTLIDNSIGVDVGVAKFAYTSDNSVYHLDLGDSLDKMIKAQKVFSRKQKHSCNSRKAKQKLNRKHKKILNKRKDFIHKTTNKLAKNELVVVENLKIGNMTKSAKGTIDNPKKSGGKRGLNRVILQQGWGMFFTTLEYKVKRNGGIFLKVNPAYTSQTCSGCGNISKASRKSQSEYLCERCGLEINADYNASINIVERGERDYQTLLNNGKDKIKALLFEISTKIRGVNRTHGA